MFCPKCGNLLNDNEKYCRSCGAKVERSESKVNAPCDHSHGTTELPPVTLGEAVRLFFTRYVDFEAAPAAVSSGEPSWPCGSALGW